MAGPKPAMTAIALAKRELEGLAQSVVGERPPSTYFSAVLISSGLSTAIRDRTPRLNGCGLG